MSPLPHFSSSSVATWLEGRAQKIALHPRGTGGSCHSSLWPGTVLTLAAIWRMNCTWKISCLSLALGSCDFQRNFKKIEIHTVYWHTSMSFLKISLICKDDMGRKVVNKCIKWKENTNYITLDLLNFRNLPESKAFRLPRHQCIYSLMQVDRRYISNVTVMKFYPKYWHSNKVDVGKWMY